ncbi:hypothetical protein [Myxacorys almedinensis]|uniref:Uncharacterized protein n=1 Tax=Myxacorys almedinensis A TaxID=2690445 RepID=A0A8J7Z6T4_9CYAN|nr:hypothetical protein [Myxacorys almedinensis]NDJ16545.1 hypothetical protein [Myxacorys almedinensis A]
MKLEFVPVEEFYFALTLVVRTLEDISTPGLADQVHSKLEHLYGQASTVAAASQNTFSYVFRVLEYDHSLAPQLVVSISDWQGKLRLSSDYGWTLDSERKPIRTNGFEQRSEFAQDLRSHLTQLLGITIEQQSTSTP